MKQKMAKKNNELEVVAESKFDGRLLPLFGTNLLQVLVIVIMAAIGAAIAVALGSVSIVDNSIKFATNMSNVKVILGYVAVGVFTFIGICWANIIFIKWDTKHVVISGQRLQFKAGALNLFFNIIKWIILSVITLGIYTLWLYIKIRKWMVKHTVSSAEESEDDACNPQVSYYSV